MREPIPHNPVTPGGKMVNRTRQGESRHLRCRIASSFCARGCKRPRRNCTCLKVWMEKHGPLPVDDEAYYFHISGVKV